MCLAAAAVVVVNERECQRDLCVYQQHFVTFDRRNDDEYCYNIRKFIFIRIITVIIIMIIMMTKIFTLTYMCICIMFTHICASYRKYDRRKQSGTRERQKTEKQNTLYLFFKVIKIEVMPCCFILSWIESDKNIQPNRTE